MEHAKSNVRGTHEHRYAVLNVYRYMLEVANPGSKMALSLDENGRFKYFFISYAAWITGFQEMRKVIAVDGTFLRSKYEGVLLSAVAQDAENHIFPVAFCVVDKEWDASYEYFFQNMRSFVDDTDELCIISDRHPTKAYDICEFNDQFNQIRDLVPKAAETLERIGFHTWSRAFYLGNRYNIMTSNSTESVNSMFDIKREFPIVALFEEINRRFALLFHQRRMELVNFANRFVPSIEKDISKYVNSGNKLLAHQIANYKFSVTGHGDVATVDLQRRTLEIYIMAYCEDIHPVPPEDSWIVPLDVIEREIPPPYVDQRKPGRRRYKRRCGFDFFNLNDPTALGMISQAADGGHIGASYVLAIISIFNGDESMRKGLISSVLNQVANEPSVYQKVILLSIPYEFFKRSDSNGLGILSQAADGGHIGASYVLAIISIFNGDESMREG
ncbi:uncharacterized protein [Solanum tuberosum]|uniref:uncharacterized protein n=1 Tax=Solanum tuberosum TaxID=4113 RepID=UPI00073A2E1F|nr:PREDICTED: uncharacterized protein LOC107060351 [Solanum tuberosum]